MAALRAGLQVIIISYNISDSHAGRGISFWFPKKWSKTKILQVPSYTSNSTVQVAADGHVEVVNAFVYLGSMVDSSGGSRKYSVKLNDITCYNSVTVTHLGHKFVTDKNVFNLEVTVYNWRPQ